MPNDTNPLFNANRLKLGVYYLSLAEHPFYQEQFGWQSQNYPVAAKYGSETISLPLSPEATDSEVDYIIETVSRMSGTWYSLNCQTR